MFDVESYDELHAVLTSLPLYRFMTSVHVTPLARHPSALARDQATVVRTGGAGYLTQSDKAIAETELGSGTLRVRGSGRRIVEVQAPISDVRHIVVNRCEVHDAIVWL